MGKTHLVLLLLWLLLLVSHSHGSRQSAQIFKMKPMFQNSPRTFFGFFPKAMPIPPSGPSRKHNDIGLQSTKASSP
ncbi:hypothetical protein MANES_18G089800v8 [Manihot esculenta]|uniref:Uncharacterized protein n=1 Tax=Manihot esculenta TaxID=3983 RepID=A0A2C9U3D8_MANES|nr:hypothetical protein MANES_18G089800v8 [Manihot esculenta]